MSATPAAREPTFDAIFAEEYPAIVASAAVVLEDWNLAQDLAQESFVKLLLHWEKVSRYDKPGAWIRKVTIREAVRVRTRQRREILRWRSLRPAAADDAYATVVDRLALGPHLRGLSAGQRAAIALHYFSDMSTEDAAALLGVSSGTIKTHLARGRRALSAETGLIT
jgi:RNA polymerase sigma-70 factor (ECF subfamily)